MKINHAASTNAVVDRMANAVIDTVTVFDPRVGAMLQGRHFDAFNRE
jgi:hypothetical protein